MLASPLAARLGLLFRGQPLGLTAARLSSSKFSTSRTLRRSRISSATFCSSVKTEKMAETSNGTGATIEEVEALRKQVEDLKVLIFPDLHRPFHFLCTF